MTQEANQRLKRHPQHHLETPYSSYGVLDLGVLSILFSFGRPVAFDYLDGPKMLDGLPRFSSKHVYTWRDFRKISILSSREFDSALLDAINQESTSLKESGAMAPYEEVPLDEQPSRDPAIDELDAAIDDEDDDDLEDDDDYLDDDDDLYDDDDEDDDWIEPEDDDDDEGVVN